MADHRVAEYAIAREAGMMRLWRFGRRDEKQEVIRPLKATTEPKTRVPVLSRSPQIPPTPPNSPTNYHQVKKIVSERGMTPQPPSEAKKVRNYQRASLRLSRSEEDQGAVDTVTRPMSPPEVITSSPAQQAIEKETQTEVPSTRLSETSPGRPLIPSSPEGVLQSESNISPKSPRSQLQPVKTELSPIPSPPGKTPLPTITITSPQPPTDMFPRPPSPFTEVEQTSEELEALSPLTVTDDPAAKSTQTEYTRVSPQSEPTRQITPQGHQHDESFPSLPESSRSYSDGRDSTGISDSRLPSDEHVLVSDSPKSPAEKERTPVTTPTVEILLPTSTTRSPQSPRELSPGERPVASPEVDRMSALIVIDDATEMSTQTDLIVCVEIVTRQITPQTPRSEENQRTPSASSERFSKEEESNITAIPPQPRLSANEPVSLAESSLSPKSPRSPPAEKEPTPATSPTEKIILLAVASCSLGSPKEFPPRESRPVTSPEVEKKSEKLQESPKTVIKQKTEMSTQTEYTGARTIGIEREIQMTPQPRSEEGLETLFESARSYSEGEDSFATTMTPELMFSSNEDISLSESTTSPKSPGSLLQPVEKELTPATSPAHEIPMTTSSLGSPKEVSPRPVTSPEVEQKSKAVLSPELVRKQKVDMSIQTDDTEEIPFEIERGIQMTPQPSQTEERWSTLKESLRMYSEGEESYASSYTSESRFSSNEDALLSETSMSPKSPGSVLQPVENEPTPVTTPSGENLLRTATPTSPGSRITPSDVEQPSDKLEALSPLTVTDDTAGGAKPSKTEPARLISPQPPQSEESLITLPEPLRSYGEGEESTSAAMASDSRLSPGKHVSFLESSISPKSPASHLQPVEKDSTPVPTPTSTPRSPRSPREASPGKPRPVTSPEVEQMPKKSGAVSPKTVIKIKVDMSTQTDDTEEIPFEIERGIQMTPQLSQTEERWSTLKESLRMYSEGDESCASSYTSESRYSSDEDVSLSGTSRSPKKPSDKLEALSPMTVTEEKPETEPGRQITPQPPQSEESLKKLQESSESGGKAFTPDPRLASDRVQTPVKDHAASASQQQLKPRPPPGDQRARNARRPSARFQRHQGDMAGSKSVYPCKHLGTEALSKPPRSDNKKSEIKGPPLHRTIDPTNRHFKPGLRVSEDRPEESTARRDSKTKTLRKGHGIYFGLQADCSERLSKSKVSYSALFEKAEGSKKNKPFESWTPEPRSNRVTWAERSRAKPVVARNQPTAAFHHVISEQTVVTNKQMDHLCVAQSMFRSTHLATTIDIIRFLRLQVNTESSSESLVLSTEDKLSKPSQSSM